MAEATIPATGEQQKPDPMQAAPAVKRPRVFFDITIDDNDVGRVVFELFSVSGLLLAVLLGDRPG
jgi:hypothetical protein